MWQPQRALFELLSREMGPSSLHVGEFAGLGCKWGCDGARAQEKGSAIKAKTYFSLRGRGRKGTTGPSQMQ